MEPRRDAQEGTRTVAAVAGGIVALLAAGILVAGTALLWLSGQRDDDGYFTTGAQQFASPTFAISTDNLEVAADAPRWLFDEQRLSTVRIRVREASKPLFVAVGPKREVDAFLADVPHQVATAVGRNPFGVEYREAIGSRPPQAPRAQGFWVASALTRGGDELAWDVEPGTWSVVVMNADGSAGIDARLDLGARVDFLVPTGVAMSVAGALILLGGLGAVVFALLSAPVGFGAPPGTVGDDLEAVPGGRV